MLDEFIVLDSIPINTNTSTFVIGSSSNDSLVHDVKWHARLGHIGQDQLKRLAKVGLLGSIEKIDLPIYEHCLARKATRFPFGKAKRVTLLLQLIHYDIYGPMNVRARHGAHYFITFIDDFTRYGHAYLISHKSEASECLKRYSRLVKNQLNVNIKALWTDLGHEYLSNLFKIYYDVRV